MDSKDVRNAINERLELIEQLHELTDQQTVAIQDGSMSELMQLLSKKQAVIQRVLDSSTSIRQLLAENAQFVWHDSGDEAEYRRKHQLCESMLADLLEREADCEQMLSSRRDDVVKELHELGRAHDVASRYAQASAPSSGTTIDFSSDR